VLGTKSVRNRTNVPLFNKIWNWFNFRPDQKGLESTMPMREILSNCSFSPEEITVLGEALDLAWERLSIDPRFSDDARKVMIARELLAMRILPLARGGENNRYLIVARAIAFVTDQFNPPPRLRTRGSSNRRLG
jgi:hypothetical protein